MKKEKYRIETDSMGDLKVPMEAKWGAQTQRALDNFCISDLTMPSEFISALGLIKWSAALTNEQLGLVSKAKSNAIQKAAQNIIDGEANNEFLVDVFQTGSGTSSNMNANEVIANMASLLTEDKIHPNDDVNMSQSSNDVVPTAINVAAMICLKEGLLPALNKIISSLAHKSNSLKDVVKTGRTHLMDAMPITLSQEIDGWKHQLQKVRERIEESEGRLSCLAQGGTAVGTGINAHPDFSEKFVKNISKKTSIDFKVSPSYFESMSSQDSSLELSSHLRLLATCLIKISNDLRWMNSGPFAGISEIKLPELQPGSSIMPGKVNPVIPEAVIMACAQVIGNDVTIAYSAQSGNFQLNVMLPVIAYNLIQSINIMTNAISSLDEKAISGFEVNLKVIDKNLTRNPILVTALNSKIGYELGAKIAKKAYQQSRSIKDVAMEMTDLSEDEIDQALDPLDLTKGGLK